MNGVGTGKMRFLQAEHGEALAVMRKQPYPALPELSEATQAVICGGDATPRRLMRRQLIVSERMGAVPTDAPMTPLQRDLRGECKRLRLRRPRLGLEQLQIVVGIVVVVRAVEDTLPATRRALRPDGGFYLRGGGCGGSGG